MRDIQYTARRALVFIGEKLDDITIFQASVAHIGVFLEYRNSFYVLKVYFVLQEYLENAVIHFE